MKRPALLRSLSLLIAPAVVASTVLAMRAAAAPSQEDEERARADFEEGKALRTANQWDDACVKFSEAYSLAPRPGTALAFGECEVRAGHLKAARAVYQTIVDDPHAAENADRLRAAKQAIASIDAKLAAQQATTATPSAEPSSSSQAAPSSAQSSGPAPVVPAPKPGPSPARSETTHMNPVPGGILLGVGGAALIAGGALGGVALNQSNDVQSQYHCVGKTCPAAAKPAATSAMHLANGADACFAVGGAAAVVGVVLLFSLKKTDTSTVAPTANGMLVRFQ